MAFKFLDTQDILGALQQQEDTARQRFQHLCDQVHEVLRRLPDADTSAADASSTDTSSTDATAADSPPPAATAVVAEAPAQIAPVVESSPQPPSGMPDSGEREWETIVLGPQLAGDRALAAGCRALVAGLAAGEPRAMTMAAQLLLFRSAAVERYPQLLKDLGEAYYGWRPALGNDNGRFEAALVAWLSATCAAAGLANSIERVEPGDRFDPTRHQAPQSGAEVAEVCGWVILRDNGKVYTRAAVTVR